MSARGLMIGGGGVVVAGMNVVAAVTGDVHAAVMLGGVGGAIAGYAVGWRHALAAARRARASHNAEENRRRTEQEQQIAKMNRRERRHAAQAAARSVSRKGGRG